jgi:hypothetical protein
MAEQANNTKLFDCKYVTGLHFCRKNELGVEELGKEKCKKR